MSTFRFSPDANDILLRIHRLREMKRTMSPGSFPPSALRNVDNEIKHRLEEVAVILGQTFDPDREG